MKTFFILDYLMYVQDGNFKHSDTYDVRVLVYSHGKRVHAEIVFQVVFANLANLTQESILSAR